MSKRKPIPNDPVVVPLRANMPPKKIGDVALARSKAKPAMDSAFVLPDFPKMATPRLKADRIAFDTQVIEVNAWASQNIYAGAFNNGATFLGYPYLSQLSQVPEYRKIVETIAMHMTRKFIKIQGVGDSDEGESDKSEKIKQITDALDNFKIRDVFRKAAEVDGYFGRAHLYIDLGYADAKELKMPIGTGRDALSKIKVTPGSVKGFKIIEPVWCYPSNYDSNNPLTSDWYNPQSWFVMQREIHESRCLRMVGREVPDLLKPAYSFGGLSLSQMAKPYVDNWLRTRQSVADLIWSFSVSGIKTDLSTSMTGDGQALYDRAELFNNLRNNRGMMLLDKDVEEFFQVATPLGTLDKLQAQAQEHMASVSSIPLVFLLGITPSGLNASSEGEIRAFYDFIHAFQEKFFKDPLTRVIDFIQLHLFGEVDPEITFVFEPLWSMTEKEVAEVDKTTAETDDLRINGGVISPLEARKRVANAPDTPYQGLDMSVIPVPPGSGDTDGDGEPDPEGAPPIGGEGLDPGKPEDVQDEEPIEPRASGEGEDNPFAQDENGSYAFDADFKEGDHPRGQPGNAGQFGAGGGGSAGGGNNASASSSGSSEEGSKASGGEKSPGMPEQSSYKQIKTNQDFFDIVNASSERGGMTDQDKQVLNHYTSPAYAPLNKALRGGKKLSPEAQQVVTNLDKAINDSVIPENLTLFRGLRGGKVREMMDSLLPGDTLTDNGFVSTSLAKHVASDQGAGGKKTTMVIRAPKGANAAFPGEHSYNAKNDQKGSKVDDALEAILPRGSQFKFLGKKGATYEFELVHNKGAKDEQWSEAKHPRGQPGNAGQFGPGGSGAGGPGPEGHEDQDELGNPKPKSLLHHTIMKALNKKTGISSKVRQELKNYLKEPGLDAATKQKLQVKIAESYTAKAQQLQKSGDPKSSALYAKAQKWAKLSIKTGGEIPQQKPETMTSGPAKSLTETVKPYTDAEIAQAKKSTTLPNYSASKAITKFNDKWGGKTVTEQHLLEEKIDDYKAMKKEKEAEDAKVVAEQQAEQDKKNAAQKVKDKEYAEKLAKEMSDPEVAKHYENLKKIAGGLTDSRRKQLDATIKSAGLEDKINAVDCALIQAYTGSDYGPVNRQLREGSLTQEQYGYAKSLQNALMKLPKFQGIVKRGTNLPTDVFAKYKPGFIVQERGFTSTGEGYKFSGSHTYEIEATAGRDVRNISSQGPGEQEVIFPANSHFEVISVVGKHIKMRQVEDLP